MNTDEIMQIALQMAGLDEIPGDSAIYVPGQNIRRILISIDIGTAELLLAKQLGYDLFIAHHPLGCIGRKNFFQLILPQIQQMIDAGIPPHVAKKALQPRPSTNLLHRF